MSALERNPEVAALSPDEDLAPSSDWRWIPSVPLNLQRNWTFLRQYEWVPEFPVVNREEPQVFSQNLRKTRFSPQRMKRPFSACGISREIPPSLLALKGSFTPLMHLKNFHDIPLSIREEYRGYRHNSRSAPYFPPHLEMRVHFPASSSWNPAVLVEPQEEAVSTWKRRWTPGVVPPFQKIPMSQSTPDTPDSSALTRLSPWVSTHNTVASVTACRKPAWVIPPLIKFMRKDAWHMQRLDLASEFPQGFSWASIPPQNRNCLPYFTLLFTLLSFTGAVPHHLSLEKVNLELHLVSCIWKGCFSSNPSDGSLTCLTVSPGFLQLVNCLQLPDHERHVA